jgi:hypothetical protein
MSYGSAMLDFLRLFLHVLAAPFRTQAQLEAEVTLLRHQLNVLRRQAPSKPRLTAADRLLLVWLWRLFPSLRSAITIVQPDTVLRWHRSGFRLYWRWKSRSRMAIHGEPAFADQHEPKAGEIHLRTTHGPTAGPVDNLRSNRTRAQQGNHIGFFSQYSAVRSVTASPTGS